MAQMVGEKAAGGLHRSGGFAEKASPLAPVTLNLMQPAAEGAAGRSRSRR
ncbi:MAG: hypothetical protein Q8L05_03895 [Actinomycetota bacterium]|nr:hypothetical protein [Actinomycetota bacterium]MDP2288857.1 hypothetical protein [Actinomycetota bacterium]